MNNILSSIVLWSNFFFSFVLSVSNNLNDSLDSKSVFYNFIFEKSTFWGLKFFIFSLAERFPDYEVDCRFPIVSEIFIFYRGIKFVCKIWKFFDYFSYYIIKIIFARTPKILHLINSKIKDKL